MGHVRPVLVLTPLDPDANADNPAWLGPAGTVHTSLGDWAKFIRLHLEGSQGRSPLIKAETLAKMYSTGPGEDYAMGWGVVENDSGESRRKWGRRILTHAGSNGSWFATVLMGPERGAAVLVATNIAGKKAEEACQRTRSALKDTIGITQTRPASGPGAQGGG